MRLFDRIQILTLQVLHQRHLQSHRVRNISNDDWNAAKTGSLSGTPTALTGDELMAKTYSAYYQRLHDSTRLD